MTFKISFHSFKIGFINTNTLGNHIKCSGFWQSKLGYMQMATLYPKLKSQNPYTTCWDTTLSLISSDWSIRLVTVFGCRRKHITTSCYIYCSCLHTIYKGGSYEQVFAARNTKLYLCRPGLSNDAGSFLLKTSK